MHVNGYFELSSNRRAIWWSDVAADLAGEGRARSDWNLALLQARPHAAFLANPPKWPLLLPQDIDGSACTTPCNVAVCSRPTHAEFCMHPSWGAAASA